MRFVLVDHCYAEFLDWLYLESKPALSKQSFLEQREAYFDTLFATSDFYAHSLTSLGHPAEQLIVNCNPMQSAWEREHFPPTRMEAMQSFFRARRLGRNGRLGSISQAGDPRRQFDLMLKQLKVLSPDVLYVQSIYAFDNDQLQEIKSTVGVLVGEHAAMPLTDAVDFRLYDLIISSFGPTLDWLRARGVKCALNRLAFDPRVDEAIPDAPRDVDASFSGSIFAIHRSRLALLDAIAGAIPGFRVFSSVGIPIPASYNLNGHISSPLWGRDMYNMLRRSTIALNHHGDVLPYANNLRLYEATGMGCLLITDYKANLGEMFEPEKEVVAYRDSQECIDKMRFYLDDRNSGARADIMAAGRRRTLTDHTYRSRMANLVKIIQSL